MKFSTLDQWLRYQEQLHVREIDLGLARVRAVWQRLDAPLAATVITVAGTNGKGSTVAFLEAMLQAAGHRTGCYTSPHLLRYNERIRIDGEEIDDSSLMAAFEAVDRARGDTPLTYFEFGTLAALWLFSHARLDAVVLEVGLGGRLDAVNIIDPHLSLITTIGLDHQAWLGESLEAIGREKAGILRAGRPAIFSGPRMPASIGDAAAGLGTSLYRLNHHYRIEGDSDGWWLHVDDASLGPLPRPALTGEHQLQNAAGAVMALLQLADRLPVNQEAMVQGLQQVALPGRLQRLEVEGVSWLLDVAHNPQGAQALAAALAAGKRHRTHALVGMLRDKAVKGVIDEMAPWVDAWHLATLAPPRGLPAAELARYRAGICHSSVGEAVKVLRERVMPGERVVVFGSFHTVGEALAALQEVDGV